MEPSRGAATLFSSPRKSTPTALPSLSQLQPGQTPSSIQSAHNLQRKSSINGLGNNQSQNQSQSQSQTHDASVVLLPNLRPNRPRALSTSSSSSASLLTNLPPANVSTPKRLSSSPSSTSIGVESLVRRSTTPNAMFGSIRPSSTTSFAANVPARLSDLAQVSASPRSARRVASNDSTQLPASSPIKKSSNWWYDFVHQNKEERDKFIRQTYFDSSTEATVRRFRRKGLKKLPPPKRDHRQKVDYAKRYQQMLEQMSAEIRARMEAKEAMMKIVEEERALLQQKLGIDIPARYIQAALTSEMSAIDPSLKLTMEERHEINQLILQKQRYFLQSGLEKGTETPVNVLYQSEKLHRIAAKARESVLARLKQEKSPSKEDANENRNRVPGPSSDEMSLWKKRYMGHSSFKIFSIIGGYDEIRSELNLRGWKENPDPRGSFFDLKWTMYSSDIDFSHLSKKQIVNHFEGVEMLTTKLGLCKSLRQLAWLESEDLHRFYPRCYDLGDPAEFREFMSDFKITAVEGILKMFTKETSGSIKFIEWDAAIPDKMLNHPKVSLLPLYIINMAVRACRFHIETLNLQENLGEEISPDLLCKLVYPLSEDEWDIILSLASMNYKISYDVTQMIFSELDAELRGHKKIKDRCYHFDFDSPPDISSLAHSANSVLSDIHKRSKQFEINGRHNIWIIKLSVSSKGYGVTCTRDIKEVIASRNENARVVQKYIENPFLINGFKFDFRQWVLVTSWDPLVIWFYGDCVLRFASEKFDISNIENKFIHLCNHSVQKQNVRQSPNLRGLSWTSDEFTNYLNMNGIGAEKWTNKTRPTMKDIAIWTLRCCQPYVKSRSNSCELYGIDFMMDEDWNPWIIEVNVSPGLRACPSLAKKMLRDLVKVVVDLPESGTQPKVSHVPRNKHEEGHHHTNQENNSNPAMYDTGGWELIYKETDSPRTYFTPKLKPHPEFNSASVLGMQVEGKRVQIPKIRTRLSGHTLNTSATPSPTTTKSDMEENFNLSPGSASELPAPDVALLDSERIVRSENV